MKDWYFVCIWLLKLRLSGKETKYCFHAKSESCIWYGEKFVLMKIDHEKTWCDCRLAIHALVEEVKNNIKAELCQDSRTEKIMLWSSYVRPVGNCIFITPPYIKRGAWKSWDVKSNYASYTQNLFQQSCQQHVYISSTQFRHTPLQRRHGRVNQSSWGAFRQLHACITGNGCLSFARYYIQLSNRIRSLISWHSKKLRNMFRLFLLKTCSFNNNQSGVRTAGSSL